MDGRKESKENVANLIWKSVTANQLDYIPTRSGVYLLAVSCIDKSNLVVYVGKSENLNRRMKEHWSEDEPNREMRNAIAKYESAFYVFYAEARTTLLDGIESYLYDAYVPQLNDQEPSAIAIRVNLPPEVRKGKVNFK